MGMKMKLKEEMLGTKELLDSVAKGIESLGYQTLYGPEYRDAKRKEKPQVLCNTERPTNAGEKVSRCRTENVRNRKSLQTMP